RCSTASPRAARRTGATGFSPRCGRASAATSRRAQNNEQSAVTATAPDQQHENPLAEGLALRRTPDPCALVIFGASGDLTHKQLMPALYALAVRRLVRQRCASVGGARTGGGDDACRGGM